MQLTLKPNYQSEQQTVEEPMQSALKRGSISGEDKASAELNQKLQPHQEDAKAWIGTNVPIELKPQTSSSDEKGCGKGKLMKRYWTE